MRSLMWRKLQGFVEWGFVLVEEWKWWHGKEQIMGFLQFEVHII